MIRRQWVMDNIRERIPGGKWIFLESIVTSEKLVETNIRAVKLGNPDFKEKPADEAFRDFRKRIEFYDQVYETVDETESTQEGTSMWIKVGIF